MSEYVSLQHPEGLTSYQELIADGFFQIEVVQLGGFKLEHHERNPEASLSPIYIDMKMVRRSPDVKRLVVSQYEEMLESLRFDLLADIPTGITPIVATLSDRLGVGQITPRIDAKDRGTGKSVDGMHESDKGKTAVVVDDVITKGGSKFKAIDMLEEAGIRVLDVVVLIDREQGGPEDLAQKGYKFRAAMKLSQLLDYYLRTGQISRQTYQETKDYMAANS